MSPERTSKLDAAVDGLVRSVKEQFDESTPTSTTPLLQLQKSVQFYHEQQSKCVVTGANTGENNARDAATNVDGNHADEGVMHPNYSAIHIDNGHQDCISSDEESRDAADDDKSISSDRTFTTASTSSSFSSISTSSTTTRLLRRASSLIEPYTDQSGSMMSVISGLSYLVGIGAIIGLAMPKNPAFPDWWYRILSSEIGYIYFICWSFCFYPQVLLNYQRKSTEGLSPDFAILNVMGWTFYSAYTYTFYVDEDIRIMYKERFHEHAESTVQSNDAAFAIHAFILSFVYLVQIVYYNGWRNLRLKPQTWFLIALMTVPSAVIPNLIWLDYLQYSTWLDYFYMLSFFKICCTITKYTTQTVLNYRRQSTSGWNIWYSLLECVGGTLSMIQIVLDSLDMNDRTGMTGNLAKFALGLATISFDAMFFTQHYVLYPEGRTKCGTPGVDEDNNSDRIDKALYESAAECEV